MIGDSYPLGFKAALHRKDVAIALDEAARAGPGRWTWPTWYGAGG